MMNKFLEVMLGQVGMSPYWLCLGVVHTLFVHGPSIFLLQILLPLAFLICTYLMLAVFRWGPITVPFV